MSESSPQHWLGIHVASARQRATAIEPVAFPLTIRADELPEQVAHLKRGRTWLGKFRADPCLLLEPITNTLTSVNEPAFVHDN